MSLEAQVPGGPMLNDAGATLDGMVPSGEMVNQVGAYGGGAGGAGSPLPATYFLAT
jgi:hypothetical protein